MVKPCAVFAVFLFTLVPFAFSQTAPQRSDELCQALQQTATENAKKFLVTGPGSCMAEIDNGYTLLVTYRDEELSVGLTQTFLANGDPQAFWLRLSALDNLAHVALGTKQETVFDELNKMARDEANEMLPLLKQGHADAKVERHGMAQKAVLGAFATEQSVVLLASANTKDIDKMKRDRTREEASVSDVARWRKVLALSLLAFAAGAKGYANAHRIYQPIQRAPAYCFTNFLGNFAVTNCY